MQEKKLFFDLPRRSLIYLLICGAGIVVFLLAGIYPSHRNMVRMNGSIADLKARIEEQKVLFPLYQKLRENLAPQNSKAQWNPPKSGLSLRQMDNLSPIFSEMAAHCGLEAVEFTPYVKSLTPDSHFLSVGLALRGNLFDLRKFLVELAGLPYLGNIEELDIQEGSDGKQYFLKLWLMVNKSQPAPG